MRAAAVAIGVPLSAVRGRLRRFAVVAGAVRARFTAMAHELDPLLGPVRATGSVLGDAVEAIGVAARALAHLDRSRAPAVALSRVAPWSVHEAHGCRLILLERVELIDDELDPLTVLRVISELHGALVDFPRAELPSFLDSFEGATGLYRDPEQTSTMPDEDRKLVQRAQAQLDAWFRSARWEPIALHGDPWIGGNLVATSSGPRPLDFEAACVGPREWDLSSIGDTIDETPDVEPLLFAYCCALRSYVVAASCRSQPGRAPEFDQAARWHLQLLRRRLEQLRSDSP